MKKVLITGITGFAGSFLAEHLLALGEYEISGTFISEKSIENVAHIKDKLDLVRLNLMEADAVESLVSSKKPDYIYHLAALSAPGKSFENPSEVITNNITAEVNILEAARKEKLQGRILITSSAEIYGLVSPENLPIDENTPFNPTNPYAVSKLAQDYLGLQYSLAYGLDIIRARPFNHVGPRQALSFALSDFAKRIVAIEKDITPPVLKVGNLDAKRDFTDVRDMVRAYELLMEKGQKGDVYNIGSGIAHTMKEIVSLMQSMAKVSFTLEEDPSLMRPSDNPELRCDNTKMHMLTGWTAEIPLEKTIEDILEYWRNREDVKI